MELPQKKNAIDFAFYWRVRSIVAADPRMRGEPKLAWDFLFVAKARFQFRTIDVSPEEVAANQGREATAGHRCLMALSDCGYLQIIDRPRRSRDAVARSGPWKLFLNDPTDVAIARRAPQGDGQGVLFEGQDAIEQAIEEPQILPVVGHRAMEAPTSSAGTAVRRTGPPAGVDSVAVMAPHPQPLDLRPKAQRLSKTLDLRPEVTVRLGGFKSADRGCEGTTAVAIGSLLGAAQDPGADLQKRDEFSRWVCGRVPGLFIEVANEVTEAVFSGRYTTAALHRVFAALGKARANGSLRTSDPVYFTYAFRKSLRENDRAAR